MARSTGQMDQLSSGILPHMLRSRLPWHRPGFQLAVVAGLLLDVGVFILLHGERFDLASAHMLAYLTALAAGGYFLFPALRRRPSQLVTLALLILLLRGGLIGVLALLLQLPLPVVALLTALVSALLFWAGYALFVTPAAVSEESTNQTLAFVASITIYAVLLHLVYLGLPELFFEEAYYWNYSRHLDIGYLDHPPLIAWLIALFTQLAGSGEFGVRLGSFLCWVLATVYSWRLARDVSSDPRVSLWSVSLLAVLPVFFFTGFIMTPDAILIACWAATVFYLHRALVHDQGLAWLGAGVFIGLGMLAKYTMALLPLTVILYVLYERDARKWLLRYEPYLAAVIALLLFSPVIIWNFQHDWASFAFQSVERAGGDFQFDLPKQLGSILILLTPTMAAALFALPALARNPNTTPASPGRESIRLLIAFMLVPLAIFLLLSTARESKYYWTAPVWLSVIPLLSYLFGSSTASSRLLAALKRAWPPTALVFLLLYAAILHYWSLGLPGVPYRQNFHLFGWHDFAAQVERLLDGYSQPGEQRLVVVGMDRHKIASGLTYYRSRLASADGDSSAAAPVAETTSVHLFGGPSLMYRFWFPYADYAGRDMMLIADETNELEKWYVQRQFDRLGEIKQITYRKNGRQTGSFYYRLAYGYRANEKHFR